jgi:hypothetical protein
MTTDIEIINHSYTEITKERDPNEEWDGEDTITSNSIQGFKIVKPNDKWKQVDLTIGFEIKPDKTYYLVSVIHSSGDSFNHNSGEIVYIELYENIEMAEATKKIIEDSYNRKHKEESYGVEILNNSGTLYKISSSPWVGYFERLEEVQIDCIQLKQ